MRFGKVLVLLIVLLPLRGEGQIDTPRNRVMFYNVENLFDPFDDSLTRDDEFTPDGIRHWTWLRMVRKINAIYKIITAVGQWDPPVLVGLSEVENRLVLHWLTTETPLSKLNYRVVHRDSPDRRGIDVALLYRPDRFRLLESRFFRVKPHGAFKGRTREILYACGILADDTLHVFINHWPSKYGGEKASLPGRMAAALTLRQKIDSIRIFYPQARILVMGDMNDEPDSEPLVRGLGVSLTDSVSNRELLVSISAILKRKGLGSYKYRGAWGMIDQIIVSPSLLNGKHRLYTSPADAGVFSSDFILESDETFAGRKPFRTYVGYRYHGGYSDHLPVYIDLLTLSP